MKKLIEINKLWYWTFGLLLLIAGILVWVIIDLNYQKQYEFQMTYSSHRNAFRVDVETYYKLSENKKISFSFNDNRTYFQIDKKFYIPLENLYYVSIKNSPIFLDNSTFIARLIY